MTDIMFIMSILNYRFYNITIDLVGIYVFCTAIIYIYIYNIPIL